MSYKRRMTTKDKETVVSKLKECVGFDIFEHSSYWASNKLDDGRLAKHRSMLGTRLSQYNDKDGRSITVISFLPGKFFFVQFNYGARSGSIAKVIGYKYTKHNYHHEVEFLISWDDPKHKPSYLKAHAIDYTELKPSTYSGGAVYKFTKNPKPEQPDAKPLFDYYGNELLAGDMIIAAVGATGYRPRMVVGTVSRWTDHNLWIKPIDSSEKITNKTVGDVKITDVKLAVKMPESSIEPFKKMMAVSKLRKPKI